MNTPTIDVVKVSYSCPECNTKEAKLGLPYVDIKHLSSPDNIFAVQTDCSRCKAKLELRYKLKKNKKIELVDFLCRDQSVLKAVEKSFSLESA